MEIKDLVENPHQIYKTYNDYWMFLLDSYEGGIDYCKAQVSQSTEKNTFLKWAFKIIAGSREISTAVSGNLFQHPKETDKDYIERLKMSYYYNFCSPIIDIYTNHLFKQPIIEDFADIKDVVDLRRDNIDNKDGSITEFRKEVAELAQLYGHIFVVADTPRFDGVVRTKADLINNKLLPYFTIHHPQNILNWALDEFGRPYWVLISESKDANISPEAYSKENQSITYYRLWTRTDWTLYNEKYEQIDGETHNVGTVPITCFFDRQSKKARNFLGISAIADIAFIARDVYNSCSELKQILRDQTFAFLAVQGDTSDYDAVSVGTSKGLLYPRDTNKPEYISPPSSNAETYFNHIDRQVTKMFQMAKLEGGSVQPPDAIQQSGVSKAWDFNQTNSALSKKASNLEDGEMKLWQLFARWVDKDFTGSIQYPNEFSIQSLNEDLDEAEKLMKIQLGNEFNKEIKKGIIKKKFPRMNEKDLNKLIKDMESKEETPVKSESSRLLDRIPLLRKTAQNNANSGG